MSKPQVIYYFHTLFPSPVKIRILVILATARFMFMMFVCVLAQFDDWLMVYVHDVSVCVLA